MSEPEWRALNRANWDERVDIHLNAPNAYDLTRLRDGTASLDPIASAVLGPPAGLRILHLQCHFGWDTITMARAGASAVGDSATRAVVSGIILLVVVDGLFAVVYYVLDI